MLNETLLEQIFDKSFVLNNFEQISKFGTYLLPLWFAKNVQTKTDFKRMFLSLYLYNYLFDRYLLIYVQKYQRTKTTWYLSSFTILRHLIYFFHFYRGIVLWSLDILRRPQKIEKIFHFVLTSLSNFKTN